MKVGQLYILDDDDSYIHQMETTDIIPDNKLETHQSDEDAAPVAQRKKKAVMKEESDEEEEDAYEYFLKGRKGRNFKQNNQHNPGERLHKSNTSEWVKKRKEKREQKKQRKKPAKKRANNTDVGENSNATLNINSAGSANRPREPIPFFYTSPGSPILYELMERFPGFVDPHSSKQFVRLT